MFNIVVRTILRDMSALVQRVEVWMIGLAAERRCAMRLDAVADRLTGMARNINGLRERIREGDGDEPVDQDATLRTALKNVKEDIRDIRCKLVGMPALHLSSRIQRAITRVGQIAEETYASADKLQWEIAEHDARFAEPA